MYMVIDRFEGDYAVCEKEDRSMVNIKKSEIPSGAKEGDVLKTDGDRIIIDSEETSKRKAEADKLMEDTWK